MEIWFLFLKGSFSVSCKTVKALRFYAAFIDFLHRFMNTVEDTRLLGYRGRSAYCSHIVGCVIGEL